jgi:hypothetical protein
MPAQRGEIGALAREEGNNFFAGLVIAIGFRPGIIEHISTIVNRHSIIVKLAIFEKAGIDNPLKWDSPQEPDIDVFFRYAQPHERFRQHLINILAGEPIGWRDSSTAAP